MLGSAIRELAASRDSRWLAATFFKSTVQIWELRSQEKVGEFPSVFCAGARNVALAPLGELLVVGLSTKGGRVAAYDVPDGRKRWERRLVFPSSLRFHSSGQSIWCVNSRRSIIRLDVQTGDTVEVIDGSGRYIENPFGGALIVPVNDARPMRLIGPERSFEIDRRGSALLDAQFSQASICLCEAGGPVRCFSSVDGKLQWTFEPGPSSHVLRLHFSSALGAFFGILRNLQDHGPRTLLRFDPAIGSYERVCDVDAWEQVFLGDTDQLITSTGEIRDLANGALVGKLAFPLREYPDE